MAYRNRNSSVWVVTTLRPRKHGSMEDQFVAVARRLQEVGIDLTYVFAEPPAPWLATALDQAGARTLTLDTHRPYVMAGTLHRWLKEARPAFVHFHFVGTYSPWIAIARLSGATVIVNEHLHLSRTGRKPTRVALKRVRALAMNRFFDLRVAVSRPVADSIVETENVSPEKILVIENGIDTDRFAGQDGGEVRRELGLGDRPVVCCVSRLAEEKGIASALAMMPYLGRGAVLLLVGDGREEQRFRRQAAALELGDRVRFLGLRDDTERIMAASDVVVMPSHWEEAFGLSVVEAMAAGRPVVVSRSGAMPSLVGDSGAVVPKKDPAALAAAVARLLDDSLLRSQLGHAAQLRAHERYGMALYVDRVCALYGVGPSTALETRAA